MCYTEALKILNSRFEKSIDSIYEHGMWHVQSMLWLSNTVTLEDTAFELPVNQLFLR